MPVRPWVCFPVRVGLCHRAASFTYFGEVLRCPHKRIVTIKKVYIARNNIHLELIRFRKNGELLTLETLKWELGRIVLRLVCLRNWAHCYPGRVATVLSWWRRTFRDMTASVHSHFGISHISRQARFGGSYLEAFVRLTNSLRVR